MPSPPSNAMFHPALADSVARDVRARLIMAVKAPVWPIPEVNPMAATAMRVPIWDVITEKLTVDSVRVPTASTRMISGEYRSER